MKLFFRGIAPHFFPGTEFVSGTLRSNIPSKTRFEHSGFNRMTSQDEIAVMGLPPDKCVGYTYTTSAEEIDAFQNMRLPDRQCQLK